jgi:raffinose/stachyose/melibiose transport system permease protein
LKLGLTNFITGLFKTKTVLLLSELRTSIWVLIGIQTWAAIGFNLLIYRSAILAISSEIYESAEIDGAGPWTKLFYITTPLTRNVINVTVILAILGVFQLFDMIWLTTRGQPLNSTQVLATYMYTRSFIDNRTGYGSTIAIIILVTSVGLSLIQRWLFRKT